MNISELIPYANRLRFPAELEKSFHDDYYHKSIVTTRLALGLGIGLVALFSLLDFWAAPAAWPVIWQIRFLFICPVFGLVLALTFQPGFMRWMQSLLSLAMLTGGLGIAAMSAVAGPTEAAYTTYYAGLILVIMWGYTFIRLRFWYATLTGWVIVAGYQVVAIVYQDLLTAPMGMEVYINNNFFFVTANILGMFAAYFIERYTRLDFLQRRTIEAEKTKSETLLQKEAEATLRESEETFRTLVETSVDGISITNVEGCFDYLSPSYERLLGYTNGELVGQPFASLIHPDDLAEVRQNFADVGQSPGNIFQATSRIRHKNGEWRLMAGVATLLPDGRLVAYNRDVTDEKLAEEKLRESEEYFRSLIENASDAIGVIDQAGNFAYLSPAYQRIWGWTAAELLGQPFLPLIHPDDIPLAGENVSKLLTIPGYVGATEIRVRHKDGSWRVVDGKGKLLPNGNIVSNTRDVTKRRQLEDDLHRLNEELEDRVAERTAQLEATFAERTRLAEILEATSDLVAFTTLAGKTLYLNRAGRQMVGLAAEADVTTLSFADFYPPEVLALFETVGLPIALREGVWSSEVTVKHQQGHLIPVSLVGILHYAPDGTPSHLSAIMRDISEQKQAEEKLQAALTKSRRLATIIEAMPDYVGIADMQGWSLYVNQAGWRLMGKSEKDEAPWNVATCYPDTEMLGLQEMLEAMQRGGTWAGEIALQHPDGHTIPVEQTIFPLHDASGTIESYAAVIRDITERKQAEEELKAALTESRRLAAVIEATSDFVGMADLQGRPIYLNRAGRRMVGIGNDEDISPIPMLEFYPSHIQPTIQDALPQILRGETWSSELAMHHRDGHEIPISQVSFMLFTPDGKPATMTAIIRDITEQKRVEAELRQAKEAAETANRAKSTFLANMSHEIRTPMNAVIGMTGLLLNTPLNDKQRDFVETVRTSGDALLTIINDILDFSKIEAGKLDLESQPFDLRSCLESALDLLAPKAAEKGLDLAYLLADDVPGGLSGDVTRLRQILVNLVSNAVKFTEKGEVVVSVTADRRLPTADSQLAIVSGQRSAVSGQVYELHFSVRDTGLGIAADKLDRLFQSFSQLDASTTRHYGGTGLGLAISKRLAELMGGTMWAESEGAGQGSTFHFTLVAEAAPAPVRRHLQEPRPELSGKRVLIVDDNATNRRILSLQTQVWGMLAYEAATPSEALALLHQGHQFDLALLDMHLPEMDGVTLALEICRLQTEQRAKMDASRENSIPNPPSPRLPLVMLTSVGYEYRAEGEQVACFAAYLTKPVKPSQLYDVLVSVLATEEVVAQLPSLPADTTVPRVGLLAEQLPLDILLAEDVVVNQKFALLALEEMGYRADVAANGLEVLAALERRPYDIILMDVQMPEMDGLEATRRIRQWPSSQPLSPPNPPEGGEETKIPPSGGLGGLSISHQPYIIAMTANALQGDREMCLAAGMDDYVSKPVYLAELRAAVERAGRSREAQENRRWKIEDRRLKGDALPGRLTLRVDVLPGELQKSKIRNPQSAIDRAILEKLLKRPTGREIISSYLAEAAEMLAALHEAVAGQDATALAQVAHSLRGSSSYIGAQVVAALSAELEQHGRQGELTDTVLVLAQLAEEFAQVRQTLGELIK